jgi:hypothetical protein
MNSGIAVLVLIHTTAKALLPLHSMKISRQAGLGQSVGLGLLLVAGCVGLITLMSSLSM